MSPDAEPGRADRLLAKMHRVLSHDLPNQVVALQSLLQLLELEEAGRLGGEGGECLRRLHRVARKAAGQVRFLREMARLATPGRCVEQVTPATLVREIGLELQQQLPAAHVQCRPAGDVAGFAAHPRCLVLAVVEVVRMLLDRDPTGPCRLVLTGRAVADGVALDGELTWPDDHAPKAAPAGPKLSERLEVLLAEELLAGFGARLTDVSEATDRSRFTIHVSPSTGHG